MIDLSKHIAKLREQEAAKPMKADNSLLFWGTGEDRAYLPQLKGCVGSATVFLRLEKLETISQLTLYCTQKKVTRVLSTSIPLLQKLLKWDKRRAPSLDSYAGSYFKVGEIEIIFISPLKQLVTVPSARFVTTRIISKFLSPEKWFKPTAFNGFSLLEPANESALFQKFKSAFIIAADIETFKENATIRCISYTGFFITHSGEMESLSVVLPLDSTYNLAVMRRWNWELQAPKVFQNGKYDIAYLCRYSTPVYNYLFDTAHLFHSWYSELPKDLGFLGAFFIREAMYWKDLAETTDLYEYYRYNALDTWATGNCFLAMLMEAPEWAVNNYLLEFPLVFPCHMAEMRGVARDMDVMIPAQKALQEETAGYYASLNRILGMPAGTSFNVSSPKQMKELLKVLGCGDLTSTDEKNLKKARFRHPLNARIINLVLLIRKNSKLLSTYLTPGKEFSRMDGTGSRILFALNPHGTDSSRLASREHHFWCGLNIQNIPRGPAVKRTIKADPGFAFAEVDLEQAESRDTAYISGDEKLIYNVEQSPDFHSANASAFFGIPFSELWDTEKSKSLNKAIRDLAKRVNHGANYNMGPGVLIETMGEENILAAKNLLGLPRVWTYTQVAEHLLDCFHATYPHLRRTYYTGLVKEIMTTKMLRSAAYHHPWYTADAVDTNREQWRENYSSLQISQLGAWTRYCFADPTKSKSALNSYISHPPQSLNAQTLNKAYITVFKDIAINPQYADNFKLLPQIHDSIFFMYRIGHEYLCDMVRERMEIPITIRAYDGKIRTFTVPASVKNGSAENGYRALYWSETE